MHVLYAQRGAGGFLNISAKFWRNSRPSGRVPRAGDFYHRKRIHTRTWTRTDRWRDVLVAAALPLAAAGLASRLLGLGNAGLFLYLAAAVVAWLNYPLVLGRRPARGSRAPRIFDGSPARRRARGEAAAAVIIPTGRRDAPFRRRAGRIGTIVVGKVMPNDRYNCTSARVSAWLAAKTRRGR